MGREPLPKGKDGIQGAWARFTDEHRAMQQIRQVLMKETVQKVGGVLGGGRRCLEFAQGALVPCRNGVEALAPILVSGGGLVRRGEELVGHPAKGRDHDHHRGFLGGPHDDGGDLADSFGLGNRTAAELEDSGGGRGRHA